MRDVVSVHGGDGLMSGLDERSLQTLMIPRSVVINHLNITQDRKYRLWGALSGAGREHRLRFVSLHLLGNTLK